MSPTFVADSHVHRFSKLRFFHRLTLVGLILTLWQTAAYGVVVTKDSGFGAAGDTCYFDVTATGNGTLIVDTKASATGRRWRAVICQALSPSCSNNVGTGSASTFTGAATKAVTSGTQYIVLVTYDRPLPGSFPTTVTARLNGPVSFSPATPTCRSRSPGGVVLSAKYRGRHELPIVSDGSFSIGISADGSRLIQISVPQVRCGVDHFHSIMLNLSSGIPIAIGPNGTRTFARNNIPVPISGATHAHTLDIDGVFFNADGFASTPEQALGGLSFMSSGLTACGPSRWLAATTPDSDGDGWNDAAELRLGSNPGDASTPEHREVPTTPLRGPDPCHDFADNDRDGEVDLADSGC